MIASSFAAAAVVAVGAQPARQSIPPGAERAYAAVKDRVDGASAMQIVTFMDRYWRIAGNPAVSLSLDSLEFRDRGRSLKLVFSGDPFRDAGLSQLVPVDPNTTYRFSAYVKSEEIYSASAPRFAATAWARAVYAMVGDPLRAPREP